jgi:hypothetical protein
VETAMSFESDVWNLICSYPKQAATIVFFMAVALYGCLYGDGGGDGFDFGDGGD